MSLDKAIEHGKEHRKPYRDSRRFAWTCRNHGSCSWCEDTRTRNRRLVDAVTRYELRVWNEAKPW